MSEIEEGIAIHRVQSSVGALSSSIPKQQSHLSFNHLDIRSQITQFPPHINIENITKRVGIPQSHPQIPPLSPSSQIPGNYQQTEGSHSLLPPRKAHRRSNSDIPFGFSTILQSSPPLIPSRGFKGLEYVKRESIWEKTSGESKGEVVDDIFSTYLNLNNLGRLSSEDLDSRASGTKINGGDNNSDNEATSSIIGSSNNMRREGVKRSSDGDIAPTTRHYRSVSMDSIMGKMNFVDESLKLKPSSDSVGPDSDTFNLEFGNGMFTGVELKKIMTNENLAEIALTDPKRVKRILANRQSAARSKERKMRYISELETKVQTLQTETTTLSAQLTLLQRESTNLTSQNNELKFRLQAMEQQAHLRDALNEALTAEVQRLRIMSTELNGEAAKFCELSLDPRMYNEQSQQQNV